MASIQDLNTLFGLAQRHWHKLSGLIFTIASTIVFETILLNSIKTPHLIAAIIYIITIILVCIVWYCTNRIPKTPKGKVGFVVCIQYSNEEEERVIKEDFVTTLRKLLKDGRLGHTFHFVEIPRHISQSINDTDDAQKLRLQLKAHFLIFGRVRLRVLGGKECHVLDLDGIVSHKPLQKQARDQLSREFGELFPRRLHIPTENDLLTLNFTSDWTECVAKYIIGIASALSSDIDYAEQLYKDVEIKLEGLKTNFPIFSKLQQRLPTRFSEIHFARARIHFDAWWQKKDDENLLKLSFNLNKIPDEFASNVYGVLLLLGIEAFLNGRRIADAIGYTKKCKRFDDPTWHLNLAFLYAYENDLKRSINQYRICANYEISLETLSQVENFIVWVLEQEPDKYQYHYCLGFFNWKMTGNLSKSVQELECFLKQIKEGEFPTERQFASKWIAEIEKELNKATESHKLNS